mgnify:CR=1 FL=1
MPSVSSLITQLTIDYPSISFQPAKEFRWSAEQQIIFIDPMVLHAEAFCLHELSHAILKHYRYNKDIDLVKLERDAWDYAQKTLSGKYNVTIPETVIQDNLDTYRDWLHARSSCPTCGASGVQSNRSDYHCIACGQNWQVNEARICALRRYKKMPH